MTWGLGILFGVIGAAVGLGSGWLAVLLERMEKLEEEEREEREDYEKAIARDVAATREKGEKPPKAPPWLSERYGWTWLERTLSPALCAFGFALFVSREGISTLSVEHLLWLAIFVHIIGFDLKHRLILNWITYPSIGIALILATVTPGLSLGRAATGAVCIAGFFWLFSLASRGGIGLGDVKLGALIGAITGLSFDGLSHLQAISAVITGIFLGGLVAFLLLVTRVRGLKDPIPYGPFLCIGATVVLYQTLFTVT
ncbi:MAG: prepilin peptidase [Candidatus Dormibacteria bacterium]